MCHAPTGGWNVTIRYLQCLPNLNGFTRIASSEGPPRSRHPFQVVLHPKSMKNGEHYEEE
jgi:hypothetical protein